MGVSQNRGTPKRMVYNGNLIKLMIWGYQYFWKHPYLSTLSWEGFHWISNVLESLTQSFAETAPEMNLQSTLMYVYIYIWMLMYHCCHVVDSLCLTPLFLFSLTSLLFTLGPGVIDVTQDIDALQKDAGLSSMVFFIKHRGFELENMFETVLLSYCWWKKSCTSHRLLRSLCDYLQGFIHSRWLFGISSINM